MPLVSNKFLLQSFTAYNQTKNSNNKNENTNKQLLQLCGLL